MHDGATLLGVNTVEAMGMTDFVPRPFRLQVEGYDDYDDYDEGYDGESVGVGDRDGEAGAPEIVGWGMTLPDGSAIAVDGGSGHRSSIAICSCPDRAAFIFGADLVWLADPPPAETSAPAGSRAAIGRVHTSPS